MRKLATIRTVSNILPIKGADRIELAQVDGWLCIVKKGEFSVGDKGVYFEIDSLLPNTEPYLFLGKPKNYRGVKLHRIKTMKMKGVLSQGLLLPMSYFKDITKEEVGTDLTELLGITKYEPTNFNGNNGGKSNARTLKPFPTFIPKTDQERIQNIVQYFDLYRDMHFEETLKLDGSSETIYKVKVALPWYKRWINKVYPLFNTSHFGVCSRNIELVDESEKSYDERSNFWKVVDDKLMSKVPVGYAIQGELVAPNIQMNHEKVSKPEYYVFNVFDIEEGRMLLPKERMDFLEARGIKSVPIVNNSVQIFKECSTLDDLLKRVEGQSINKGTVSEGRVYKSTTHNVTFKAISNKYLLKEK